jgi:pilus assembly protein FimV
LIAKSYRWELTAVALAALLALGGSNAQALSLGRITVQSALGEPLNAEIDIPDINADEATSLKVQVALPATFKSAGLDYSPVLTGLRMVLQKRPDGRSYLRLSSDQLVQEPFVDLILDAAWQSGRVVRNYTMLFDPPGLRPTPMAQPRPAPLSVTTPRVAPLPRPAPQASPQPVARQPAMGAEVKSASPAPSNAPRLVTVQSGETASKIAMSHKLSNVSLDQMLVALQRGNPNAFIEGNVNRIKAGAILALPTAKQASDVSPTQASQIITAQSQDFNRYRLALANNPSMTQLAPAERNISGTIQATVEDKKQAAQTPDKLTLSKGSVQSAADLEQLALARNAEDSAKRAAQVSQNTNDLNQLAQTAAAMAAAGTASSTAAGAVVAAAVGPVSAPGVQKPIAPTLPSTALATAPAPVSGFLDELIDNPLLPASAAALVVLLAGLGFYKVRQRQKKATVDSSFMESGFHAESFFGNSGGQKVDTQESSGTSSAMVYSASQLDAAEEADPVAEADVYLAYGRDIQAEEVLKEALLKQPERVAIHQKLLAIYAKRQDANAYAVMAALAYPLLQNSGPQWAQICASGLALEPGNAMYLAGGQPVAVAPTSPLPPLPVIPLVAATEVEATEPADTVGDSALDLDLDLDFSLDEPEPVDVAEPAAPVLPVMAGNSLPELEAVSASSEPVAATVAPTVASTPSDMLEFDFDSLSLDLDDSDVVPTKQPPLASADALKSKLTLAEEFKASGDAEGARALIQQVINEADGPLKARAQQALSQF